MNFHKRQVLYFRERAGNCPSDILDITGTSGIARPDLDNGVKWGAEIQQDCRRLVNVETGEKENQPGEKENQPGEKVLFSSAEIKTSVSLLSRSGLAMPEVPVMSRNMMAYLVSLLSVAPFYRSLDPHVISRTDKYFA